MSGADFQREVCIDVAHAALPGHFPGHPLVPAVILLRLSQAPSAADGGERVRFEIQREGNLLARGVVEGTA